MIISSPVAALGTCRRDLGRGWADAHVGLQVGNEVPVLRKITAHQERQLLNIQPDPHSTASYRQPETNHHTGGNVLVYASVRSDIRSSCGGEGDEVVVA